MQLKITKSTSVDEVDEYLEAKRAATEASKRLELATAALTEKMERDHRKTYTVKDGGKVRKVTYVQNTTTVVNEDSFKKEIGARAFNKLTTAKLDRKKLEAALDTGEVDPIILGKHTETKPSKAFIRYTEGTADDAEE